MQRREQKYFFLPSSLGGKLHSLDVVHQCRLHKSDSVRHTTDTQRGEGLRNHYCRICRRVLCIGHIIDDHVQCGVQCSVHGVGHDRTPHRYNVQIYRSLTQLIAQAVAIPWPWPAVASR